MLPRTYIPSPFFSSFLFFKTCHSFLNVISYSCQLYKCKCRRTPITVAYKIYKEFRQPCHCNNIWATTFLFSSAKQFRATVGVENNSARYAVIYLCCSACVIMQISPLETYFIDHGREYR